MNRWRFLGLFLIGIIVSICFACTQIGDDTQNNRSPFTQDKLNNSPQTAAIIASLGARDLYNPPPW